MGIKDIPMWVPTNIFWVNSFWSLKLGPFSLGVVVKVAGPHMDSCTVSIWTSGIEKHWAHTPVSPRCWKERNGGYCIGIFPHGRCFFSLESIRAPSGKIQGKKNRPLILFLLLFPYFSTLSTLVFIKYTLVPKLKGPIPDFSIALKGIRRKPLSPVKRSLWDTWQSACSSNPSLNVSSFFFPLWKRK